jgi:hypothetical protein
MPRLPWCLLAVNEWGFFWFQCCYKKCVDLAFPSEVFAEVVSYLAPYQGEVFGFAGELEGG